VTATRSLRTGPAGPPAATIGQVELVRALHAGDSVPATFRLVVELAGRAVAGCEHASVTAPGPRTPASTGELPLWLDALQHAAGGGPCVEAMETDRPSRSADLATESRWRPFAAAAGAAGIRSVLSCPLSVGAERLGSLTLYAAAPGVFGPRELAAGSAYAALAAAALARAADREQVTQLQQAVASNRVIGTAIGMLMQARRISEAEAFDLLRVASQHSNRKLRDIAADLVGRSVTA
jgi:GAF domain-containing protein